MAKRNKNLLIYIVIGIVLLIGIICLFVFLTPNSNEDINNINTTNLVTNNSENKSNNLEETTKEYTFTQVITYSDENLTTKITKNKLLKTATIEFNGYLDENELITEGIDLRELTTLMFCGLMQMGIYDRNAVDEWNNQVTEWNSQEYTVEDDSPPEEQETTILDPLEGYTVTNVHVLLSNKSKEKISECTITGKEESQMSIIRYYEVDNSEDTEE